MTHHRLNHIPTEKKIALFFTGVVFVIVSSINVIIFYTTQSQWEYNKTIYAEQILASVHTRKDATDLDNVRVFDEKNTVVFNAGIFSSLPKGQIKHNSIIRFDGSSYFISLAKTGDGWSICYAQNITDFINTRNSIFFNTLVFSLLSLFFIYFIGIYFSRSILAPIRKINKYTKQYSLHSNISIIPWDGNKNDDIGILTKTLNTVFTTLQKESAKTEQFSADVGHEFKNSLSELKTHIQIMQAKEIYSEACLSKMNETVDCMNTLLESLILLARLDQTTLETEEMPINGVISTSQKVQHSKVLFKWDTTIARVHSELFTLAINNIISNAIKFTPEDGRVMVTLENGILTVEDNGIGIKSEHISKIWDRFYKESEDREYQSGYGIGLSLTKKILDMHGFSAEVKSVVGVGTQFRISMV